MSAWRPLPPPPPLPPAPAASASSPEAQAGRAALAVLQGLLSEALDPVRLSPVAEAWGCLRPGRVPAFAELREQLPEAYHGAPAATAEAGGEAELSAADEAVDSAGLAATLKDGQFQAFAEFVLESALLGLVGESAAGEWMPPSGR